MSGFDAESFRAHVRQRLRQCDVPERLHDGLVEYLVARRPVGGFLNAVLENNLALAVARADPDMRAQLPAVVLFLANYASSKAWGSTEAVAAWLTDPVPPRPVFE